MKFIKVSKASKQNYVAGGSKNIGLELFEFVRTFVLFAFSAITILSIDSGKCHALEITGAGSTFVYPLYMKWAEMYKAETGINIQYEPLGSGDSIDFVRSDRVQFAVSEIPLSHEALKSQQLIQWPQLISGVVCIFNLDIAKTSPLILDGASLAKIYLGEISHWNDPEIQKLNPNITLPNTLITPVYRMGKSGTNFVFADYLAEASEHWRSRFPDNTSILWPVGAAEKGNEGVENKVKSTKGSIGFVSYSHAVAKHLSYALHVNRDGAVVKPNPESFYASAQNVNLINPSEFHGPMTNERGLSSWPIVAVSYVIMKNPGRKSAAMDESVNFFEWTLVKGQKIANRLGYVYPPDQFISEIRNNWRNLKSDDNNSGFK